MPNDPLNQVRELAEHTIKTYGDITGYSFVTGHSAAEDAKAILKWLDGISVRTIWQCQECEEFSDEIANGRCPYEDCRGPVAVLTVIQRRRRARKR